MNRQLLIFSLLFFWGFTSKAQENIPSAGWLKNQNCKLSVRINRYEYEKYNRRVSEKSVSIDSDTLSFENIKFLILKKENTIEGNSNVKEFEVSFKCIKGSIQQASLSLDFTFSNWSSENYVLMPGVVYNGNKFKVYKSPDWFPFVSDPRYVGANVEPIATDIPRLDREGGVSRIQMRSGHMTTPSIGFHSPKLKKGFWLLTEQGNQLGDYGIDIEENRKRTEATISITAPVVREVYRYKHMNNQFPSSDSSANFKEGDEIKIRFRMYFFESQSVQTLFDKFLNLRKDFTGKEKLSNSYPYSNTFSILEKKYNLDNWDEKIGYYKLRPEFLVNWQIGWMGGAIFTYSLLLEGNKESKERVLKMMDWLFTKGISPSGYFWDSSIDGIKFHGIYKDIPIADSITLVRCNGDGLYYAVKHFMAMKKLGIPVKPFWEEKTKGVANAFIKTWNTDHQLGQYVSQFNGRVVVGNSTSGAIVPAALVLASNYFNDAHLLSIAEEMGEHFYQLYTKKGLTYGGPGDALQNPDCESSFGLVESFVLLYEKTQNKKWLIYAEQAANQFSTWVLSYNFKFPSSSFYGKMGIKPMGAVFANPQNGTGTPAICTYSGASLLKLYRATGNLKYAELLQDIAHNIPQYLSHPDRKLNPDHIGWMSERVVTADWLEEIGEIGLMSTWPEASLAVSYCELPGVYINTLSDLTIDYDNVESKIIKSTKDYLLVSIKNPTKLQASVKLFTDNQKTMLKPMGELAFSDMETIVLKPNETKIIKKKK